MELKIPTSANRYSAIDASAAIIALLLIFAGSSKIQANTFRVLYVANSPKEILLVLLGALEVAWSMWFFVNSRTRHAWIFTLAIFTSFLIYGIYAMYTFTPCECFGKILNETWWVVILDAAVIIVVAIVLRRNSLVPLVKWSLFTPAAFGLIVVVLAVAGNSFLHEFSSLTQSIQLVKEKVSVSGISPETREFVADVRIMNSSRQSPHVPKHKEAPLVRVLIQTEPVQGFPDCQLSLRFVAPYRILVCHHLAIIGIASVRIAKIPAILICATVKRLRTLVF